MSVELKVRFFRTDEKGFVSGRLIVTAISSNGTSGNNCKLVITESTQFVTTSNTLYVDVEPNKAVTIYNGIRGRWDYNSIPSVTFKVSLTVAGSTIERTLTKQMTTGFALPAMFGIDDSDYYNAYFNEQQTFELSDVSGYLSTNTSGEKYDGYVQIGNTKIKVLDNVSYVYGAKWNWTPSIDDFASEIGPTDLKKTMFPITYVKDESGNAFLTYNSSAYIGSSQNYYKWDIRLPSSIRPTISTVTPSDTKGYRAKFGVYVQGKSILAATTEASGIYNSTITKVDYVIDNKTGSTTDISLVKTIGLLEQSGSRTLTTTVTDTRGRTGVKNLAITVVPYVNPSLTFQANRWNTETAQESDDSTTVRLVCSGEVPSINDVLVTGTLTVQGRQKGVAAWTTIGTASVSGTFEEIFTKTNQLQDNSYEYQVTLADEFGVTITQSSEVGTSTPVLEFHASGKGMGIGTVAPENGLAIELPITGSGLYPVGSVIIRYDHISPASLYGGVWERIEGRFLYATGASGTIGATGGSGTHTLTVDEMPAHRHGWYGVNSGTTVTTQMGTYPFDIEQDKKSNWNGTSSMIANTGGGKAHNNNPAFVNVSVWRRVE